MPYVSDAQRKKFHVLESEGKLSHKTVSEWDHASKGMALPKKVNGPGAAKKKALREIHKFASGGIAQDLEKKYRPKPPPRADVPPAATPPPDENEDVMASLDEDTLKKLLRKG